MNTLRLIIALAVLSFVTTLLLTRQTLLETFASDYIYASELVVSFAGLCAGTAFCLGAALSAFCAERVGRLQHKVGSFKLISFPHSRNRAVLVEAVQDGFRYNILARRSEDGCVTAHTLRANFVKFVFDEELNGIGYWTEFWEMPDPESPWFKWCYKSDLIPHLVGHELRLNAQDSLLCSSGCDRELQAAAG